MVIKGDPNMEEEEDTNRDDAESHQGKANKHLSVAVANLVDTLHEAHLHNAQYRHMAERPRSRPVSMMPVTSFVFEFFLFNSVYQVDWPQSLTAPRIAHLPQELTESKKQTDLIKFLKSRLTDKPTLVFDALEPLLLLDITQDDWTRVVADSRISHEDGSRFFSRIRSIQERLAAVASPAELPVNRAFFNCLKECVIYISAVRNNIFHGSKKLLEVYDSDQKKRIEVYDVFLKCINSMFFLAMGKSDVASNTGPQPIAITGSPLGHIKLSRDDIMRITNSGLMKEGDTRLINKFNQAFPNRKYNLTNNTRSALFYPSSGKDWVTPILLGMPTCTDFYFYDNDTSKLRIRIESLLRDIRPIFSIRDELKDRSRVRPRSPFTDTDTLVQFAFEFESIKRTIHWVREDNLQFLASDVKLAFYFHRGDSLGEGGSGQRWDSTLLPDLFALVPKGQSCYFLTDGEPGQFHSGPLSDHISNEVTLVQKQCEYHFGKYMRDGIGMR